MAVFKPESLLSQYHRWEVSPKGKRVIQWSLDARRALILAKRLNFKDLGESPLITNNLDGLSAPNTTVQTTIDPYRNQLEKRRVDDFYGGVTKDQVNIANSDRHDLIEDSVYIIDIDYNNAQGGNGYGHRVIKLPFIPKELKYSPTSHFAVIKPMGRNTPLYHFTGAEDKLDFEIDWYSFNDDRMDVITNCRILEALSKGDGYEGKPHRVILQWGDNDKLFKDHTFIVVSAPYVLTQFSKGHINADKVLVRTSMMPVQARQTVTLARVADDNLTHLEIEKVAQI